LRTVDLSTPAQYSSAGAALDLMAVSNVRTSGVGSFPQPFNGTSAAAPHVAGIAALLIEYEDRLLASASDTVREQAHSNRRGDLSEALVAGAARLASAVPDPYTGFGRVRAPEAASALRAVLVKYGAALPADPAPAEASQVVEEAAALRLSSVGATSSAPVRAPSVPVLAASDTVQATEVDFREALSALGFEVEHVLDCAELADLLSGRATGVTDLIRLRYSVDPDTYEPLTATFGVDASDIGALEDLDLSGRIAAEAIPLFDVGFGLDTAGFFVTADSKLDASITGTVEATGALGDFAATATGDVALTPRLPLAPIDGNADGKLRIDEFVANVGNLSVSLEAVSADLSLAIAVGPLDYVDADGDATNNTEHGGDPFRFAAAATLTATIPEAEGVRFEWSDVRLLNPDVDEDGTPDFTLEVLAEDVRRLVEDALQGDRTGFLDGLRDAFAAERSPLSGTRPASPKCSSGSTTACRRARPTSCDCGCTSTSWWMNR
jgi:hypothetical protein